jgi:hypothetical protein
MALRALSRRSSKNSLQVAPLTFDLRMTASEWKASRTVIDFNVCADSSLSIGGIRHQQHRATYHEKSRDYCRGKELKPRPAYRLSYSCTCHYNSIALGVDAYYFLH